MNTKYLYSINHLILTRVGQNKATNNSENANIFTVC